MRPQEGAGHAGKISSLPRAHALYFKLSTIYLHGPFYTRLSTQPYSAYRSIHVTTEL